MGGVAACGACISVGARRPRLRVRTLTGRTVLCGVACLVFAVARLGAQAVVFDQTTKAYSFNDATFENAWGLGYFGLADALTSAQTTDAQLQKLADSYVGSLKVRAGVVIGGLAVGVTGLGLALSISSWSGGTTDAEAAAYSTLIFPYMGVCLGGFLVWSLGLLMSPYPDDLVSYYNSTY